MRLAITDGGFMRKHERGNGISRTPEYTAWLNAKNRCTNKNHPRYKDYGGRGITFWIHWYNSFDDFIEHIGPKPSAQHQLDRIDNSKGYIPGNVKWSTVAENIRNRKRPCEYCGK